jgi:hypothetical protein
MYTKPHCILLLYTNKLTNKRLVLSPEYFMGNFFQIQIHWHNASIPN